jgi:Bacterial protein of unknown function (Gcw_chp)
MRKQLLNPGILFALLMFMSLQAFAQTQTPAPAPTLTPPFTFGTDLMSRYIWRGLNLGGNSPSIEPNFTYNIGQSGLSIGAWGAFSVGGTVPNQETDLSVNYTIKAFTFTVTDYFFPVEGAGIHNNYFDYSKNTTGHVFELSGSFNGTDKIPISLLFAINLYGNDAKDANGNIVNSKYLELGYSKTIKDIGFKAFAGFVLDGSNGGAPGYYFQNSAGFTNIGLTVSKSIKITDAFSLPLKTSVIFNPEAGNIFLVLGLTL